MGTLPLRISRQGITKKKHGISGSQGLNVGEQSICW